MSRSLSLLQGGQCESVPVTVAGRSMRVSPCHCCWEVNVSRSLSLLQGGQCESVPVIVAGRSM